MVNCYEIVSRKYNINGYSGDTILILMNSDLSEDECLALFYYLERVYG
jgi:hypothetical protein